MEVHPDAGPGPVSSRCPSGAPTGARPDSPFAGRAPNLASALFVVSVLLWNPAGARGADPPANAPTDQQLGAALAAAEKLLEMGRGEEALTLIRPVADARPDSQQAAFTTGLAALAAADVAVGKGIKHTDSAVKENYNLAVRSFRGMLVGDPSQLRVRLELARALFSRAIASSLHPTCSSICSVTTAGRPSSTLYACWAPMCRRRSPSMSGASFRFAALASARPAASAWRWRQTPT